MNNQILNSLSIIILSLGVMSFCTGVILLLSCIFIKNKTLLIKISLWAILLGALSAIGGFTLCTATFHLGSMQ